MPSPSFHDPRGWCLQAVALPLLALHAAAGGPAEKAGGAALQRSDIVLMGEAKPEVYRAFGATVVSWGGRPWGDSAEQRGKFEARVGAAADLGLSYLPSAAFRTAFAGMIDFDPNFMDSVCRSIEGKPILVPWLWDHKHKGHPAYWFCTNSPRYREYLKRQLANTFVRGVTGMHIDDYAGTAGSHWAEGGGCFCPNCMAGFRAYLKGHSSPEELRALGIDSLGSLDYGAFLRGRGVDAARFQKEAAWFPEKLALSHRFLAFQRTASVAWVAEYRKWAEGVAGHPLVLCVNSAVSGPDDLAISPVVTFFSGEVPHEAEKGGLSLRPAWAYKLGDALGKPVACTASGHDWAFASARNKPGLVRAWIAQAYAFGQQFMPPVHQWCYTKEKGTHWWEPPAGEFAPLCQFIRREVRLLDGYEGIARVGLIYSNTAFRHHKKDAVKACEDLALANIPFRLLLAGDDCLPNRLAREDMTGLDAIVVAGPPELDTAQQKAIDFFEKRLVRWPDEPRLRKLAPAGIAVEGAENITVLPRAKAGAPFVCHLLNRAYAVESDAPARPGAFRVRIADALYGTRIAAAKLHAPGAEPVALEVRRDTAGAEIAVPCLDLWAILELSAE